MVDMLVVMSIATSEMVRRYHRGKEAHSLEIKHQGKRRKGRRSLLQVMQGMMQPTIVVAVVERLQLERHSKARRQ